MRKEVEQLALMGAMPNETDERITAELISEYEDLLCKIVKPIFKEMLVQRLNNSQQKKVTNKA